MQPGKDAIEKLIWGEALAAALEAGRTRGNHPQNVLQWRL